MSKSVLSNCAAPPRRSNGFDPVATRKVFEAARAKGLIRGPGDPVPVVKDGAPAARLGNVRSQWMDVTPALAAQWLKNNFRNRPVSEDVVAAYARDMQSGVWTPTHQGIAFNDRDELIDGQHRLLAVVRCGVTIHTMVTFGLPSKIPESEMTTMDAVDRGRTRSVGDQLKIQHGLKQGTVIAAACMVLSRLCFGQRLRRLSVGQVLEIYAEYRPTLDWLIERRPKAHGLRAAGVLAAFAFAAQPDAPGHVAIKERFLQLCGDPTRANDKEAAIVLLQRFLTSDEAVLLTRGTDQGLAELVLQALWLAERSGRVAKLELGQNGLAYFRDQQTERVLRIAKLFTLPAAPAEQRAS